MIERLVPAFLCLGLLAAPCIAADPVTLASFLERVPPQNDQLKEIIGNSFEGASTECGKPTIRGAVGSTTIWEYCFAAFKKGKKARDPSFLLYLEVASIAFDKNGSPIISGFGYPASIEERLTGFRVVAFPESKNSQQGAAANP